MTFHNSDQSGDASRLNALLSVFLQSPLRGKFRVQIIAIGVSRRCLAAHAPLRARSAVGVLAYPEFSVSSQTTFYGEEYPGIGKEGKEKP